MSPHTDPGALLKLAEEIERACKAPTYEVRLGTIEGKMVVAILRQAASQGRAGGERPEVRTEDVIREICGDEINGGLIRDLCFTVWNVCHNPTHADGNADWSSDTLPTVQKYVEIARTKIASLHLAQEASDCGAEIKRLRAQVEYWRLAAERREARMERSGVDVAEASTLDAPSVPSADCGGGK